VGVTSEAELMDLFCIKQTSPHGLTTMVNRELPAGIKILQAHQIALTLPSLQSQIRHTEYRVEVETKKEKKDIDAALTSLLTTKHMPWHHQRDTGPHSYDLRSLINNLWFIDQYQEYCTLGMKLRCDSNGSGRPEQVISALGFSHYPLSIHRTRLILEVK
jgi:radical SAM-linked protein